MLSFWVSMLLLMVALTMLIKTANSQPMKLKVSIKESDKSGDYIKDQETIRLARDRPGEQVDGDARARLPIAALLPIPAALGCIGSWLQIVKK